jgi:hypothetical protein
MNKFRTLTEANGYKPGQLIAALQKQGTTTGGRRRIDRWTEASDMMAFAIGRMEREYDAGDERFTALSERSTTRS